MRSSVGYVAITLAVLGICYRINVGRWKYYKWTIRTFFFIILFGSLLIVLPNIVLSPEMFLQAATWEYGAETVSSALAAGSAVADAHPFDLFDPATFADSLMMLLSAASVLFFAYNGFGTAVAVSGETKDPRRNIPKGIISAILLITVLYFVVSVSFYRFIPWEYVVGYTTLYPDAQTSDFINVSPYAGEIILISFVIMIALVSDILPWMMSISRIFFAWSFDGLMPKKFSKVNKNGMPVNALAVTYLITVLTVIESEVMGIFETLKFNTIAMLTIYMFVNITMFLLPIHKPLYYNMATFKLGRFNSLVSGIGILSALLLAGMLIGTSFRSFIVFCTLSMIGGLVYHYNYKKQLESGIDMETTFKILPPE
jgi:amino acid transporter